MYNIGLSKVMKLDSVFFIHTIYYMVSEVKNKHGPFTTANANDLERQCRRKNFTTWFQKFELYLAASEKTMTLDQVKYTLFLHVTGEKAVGVYNARSKKWKRMITMFWFASPKNLLRVKIFSPRTLCLQ